MLFENIMVPVPGNYDEVLTALYGDWHKYVMGGSDHEGMFMDPDKAYWEYL